MLRITTNFRSATLCDIKKKKKMKPAVVYVHLLSLFSHKQNISFQKY